MDMQQLLSRYVDVYDRLYYTSGPVEGYDEAVRSFDAVFAGGALVSRFCGYMGDMITSDREAAAFVMALASI